MYTDFNHNEWNETIKHEYATQAGKICGKVLYVNSFCIDKEDDDMRKVVLPFLSMEMLIRKSLLEKKMCSLLRFR